MNRELHLALAVCDRKDKHILVCTIRDRLSVVLYPLPKVIRFKKRKCPDPYHPLSSG